MNAVSRKPRKKYYTVEEANATLPLLRLILRDVTALASQLREYHERAKKYEGRKLDADHQEELDALLADFERGRAQMLAYEKELAPLQVEIKDYFTGLVDFPCRMDGHEVYLCWKLDEPEVAHWHELDAGYAGRQKLGPDRRRG